jgi:gentisate 1,2-dioxygenase
MADSSEHWLALIDEDTTMGHKSAAEFVAARDMEELYGLLDAVGMANGWNKPEPSLYPSPRKTFVPAHWSYAIAKPALDAAGRFVSTELAERRNLILNNPVPGNTYATTRTLVAAYQMVMPGETARSHRHSPNALRLVLDTAPGAYTIVEGRKLPMVPGDVLLTPNWSWHGHSNQGPACAYWIDFLDVPLVHYLEPMFFEPFPGGLEQASTVDERSPMRFPFAEVRERLESQPESQPGRRDLELGPPHIATMTLRVSRLEAGCALQAQRSTASSIFAVIEGRGQTQVEDRAFQWSRGDVFVLPSWCRCSHQAAETSYLLQVTDEPLLRSLNWLRQE